MTDTDLHDPRLYLNRELSWLRFNWRVVEEAIDPGTPPLERLKFLAIFGSNLDEFVMIRYAGLKGQVAAGSEGRSPDGMSALEQLAAVRREMRRQVARHRQVLRDAVLPLLAQGGVVVKPLHALDEREREVVERFFDHELLPVLTPLMLDASHPLPRLPNLSVSLLLELVERQGGGHGGAVVQVPSELPRFLRLPGPGHAFVILEDVIRAGAVALFPGHEVGAVHGFRITRDADVEVAGDEGDDLLQAIEDEVRRRRWGDAVRLEVVEGMPPASRERLRCDLGLEPADVFEIPHHLDVAAFVQLAGLDVPELRDAPFVPRRPIALRGRRSVFEALRAGDVLLHHPLDAFDAVVALLEEAADDPDVLAIEQTLYRVGRASPVVAALARAAARGKRVTAIVELKARFDEETNILWARELERAGVRVVHGVAALKTHCKALMVVRREPAVGRRAVRRYVHLGTGNYDPDTATHYSDFGLLSCEPDLAADVAELFELLTGATRERVWRRLWVAPETLRARLLGAIEREAEHARAGRPARIVAKMNALVDPGIIRALYAASRAGVPIDLLVRGICCLRPGIAGVSESIRVRSVVGRFLEHARAFWFVDGGADTLMLSSADWMPRNFGGRVEIAFPIDEPRLKRMVWRVLELQLRDNVKGRELTEDGGYEPVRRRPGQRRLDSFERLIASAARPALETRSR